ncbi:MAG: sulfatase-like hydrolase/transferase [Candidatus Freyarchaeota archaeon]
MDEEWDIAVILDACRYDTFKETHKRYLPSGRLEKRIGASDTLEWLTSVFNDGTLYNDVVYVSAHPGINGKDLAWGSFNANGRFCKVYDAWVNGWNWMIGTTLPGEVFKVAVQARKEHPNKKMIIHFVQPHFPYRKAPCPSTYSDLKGVKGNPKLDYLVQKLFRDLGVNLSRFRRGYWTLRKILNLKCEDIHEFYWRKYTIEDLKDFYKDNLEWVLGYVKTIVEEFDDANIVVTSDHGEAFGEHGEFFHLYKTKNPAVRLVPYWQNEP